MELFFTVGEITACIKQALECNPDLQDIWIAGEVGNITRPPSGHVYFTLKDESACLSCVMWRNAASRCASALRTGDAVLVHGRISVYEPRGVYQLTVDAVLAAGSGQLYQQFEALKQKLAAEGLFDTARKRPLPPLPRRIGVITSTAGAAICDILNILSRRYPLAEVIIAPTLVQGEEAPLCIVAALEALNSHPDIDVIILARGGGSLEELWAFNDERVARAIYASRVPVLSGIGHETDFTIADLVADLRAPTPSAAAELVAPSIEELAQRVASARAMLTQNLLTRCQSLKQRLTHDKKILAHYSPQARINTQRQTLDTLLFQAIVSIRTEIDARRAQLSTLLARLDTLSPLATLDRGYALVSDRRTGSHVGSVANVSYGQELHIRMRDGHFGAAVDVSPLIQTH